MALSPHGPIEQGSERECKRGEQYPEGACNDDRMPYQRISVVLPPCAKRSSDGRCCPTSNSAIRHHLHEHQDGEHQGHPGDSIGSQEADEIRLHHTNGRLHHEHEDRGYCQMQN